jgi:hypothetical protein
MIPKGSVSLLIKTRQTINVKCYKIKDLFAT